MRYRLNRLVRGVCCVATLALAASLSSCDKQRDEVVQSAYLDPVLPEPQYKFSRNGYSSVNILECDLIKSPIDRMYSSYLKIVDLANDGLYKDMLNLYELGEFGLGPHSQLSQSSTMQPSRAQIESDMLQLFETAKTLSGYGADYPNEVRTRQAMQGRSGMVGKNAGDDNKFFVDARGVAPAEVFRYYIMGAVYMDKVLNIHLNEATSNQSLRLQHEALDFLDGHNYTRLEHHWDLAYGYYTLLKALTAADGLPILKDSHRKILYAFVEGRRAMADFHYEVLQEQARIIRTELSQAVAVRIIDALQGPNALANLNAGSRYSFIFASQAVGLIRCLPFTLKADGTQAVSYAQAQTLLDNLLSTDGLWDNTRLTAGGEVVGSLANIAERVAQMYQINIADIKR